VHPQSIDVEQIFRQTRNKVVNLRVVGKAAPGEAFEQPIFGSGVLIRTDVTDEARRFRILTAGHVVRPNSSWAPLGSRFNRDVYITSEVGAGSQEFRPVTGVTVNAEKDIAQVVALPSTPAAADVKSTLLEVDRYYAVVSWGIEDGRAAERPTAKRVRVLGPDPVDPDLVRLEGELVPTESGSPVFDESGGVVAIVVMREVSGSDSHIALAIPVSKVANWIGGVKSNPVREVSLQPIQQVRDAQGLCVFLGKASALMRANLRYADAPFGKDFLQSIQKAQPSNVEATGFRLTDALLRIAPETGAINIRSRCPEIREGKAFYGSEVTRLTPQAQIGIGNIQPLHYLDDTFYWATVTKIILPPEKRTER
jgi:hypothetical protein